MYLNEDDDDEQNSFAYFRKMVKNGKTEIEIPQVWYDRLGVLGRPGRGDGVTGQCHHQTSHGFFCQSIT